MESMINAEQSRTPDLRTENDTNTEVQITQSQQYCAHAIVYLSSLGCWLKPSIRIISPYKKKGDCQFR